MAKAVEPAPIYVVLDSFTTVVGGVEVTYHKGEPVDPADPLLRKSPQSFGPLVFPHPVKRTAEPAVERATSAPGEKRGE
jgi:hypothetical protein